MQVDGDTDDGDVDWYDVGDNEEQVTGKKKRWIFGLCECEITGTNESGNDILKVLSVRMFAVSDRKRITLRPLIVDNVELGTKIISDCWRAYADLDKDFDHRQVNHEEEWVAADGSSTNSVEGMWAVVKSYVLKGRRGMQSSQQLQDHLYEFSYRHERDMHNCPHVFSELLNLICMPAPSAEDADPLEVQAHNTPSPPKQSPIKAAFQRAWQRIKRRAFSSSESDEDSRKAARVAFSTDEEENDPRRGSSTEA